MKNLYILFMLLFLYGITGCSLINTERKLSYIERETTTTIEDFTTGLATTSTTVQVDVKGPVQDNGSNTEPVKVEPIVIQPKPVRITTIVVKEIIQSASNGDNIKSLFQAPRYPEHGELTINPKGGISFGESTWTEQLVKAVSSLYILFWIGGIAVIGGLVLAFVFNFRLAGIIIAIGGGLLIGIGVLFEQYPWIALFIPVLIFGAIVWWFVAAKKAKDAKEEAKLKDKALKQTIEGVQAVKDGTTEEEREQINTTLMSEQDKDVQNLVKEIKTEEGIN